MTTRNTFLGAAGTVTGSKYLVETGSQRVLVDCGLFQGYRQLRLRNWAGLTVGPASIDAVVLTHARLNHSGNLPVLIRDGFKGRVYCTAAARDLCANLPPDRGHLQEPDAEFANRHRYSKYRPARPLYTAREGEAAIARFKPVAHGQRCQLDSGFDVVFAPAGHILGSAIVRLEHADGSILFSGDLGRPVSPVMPPLAGITHADHLVVESTYGGRRHDPAASLDVLADITSRTAAHELT